MVTLALIFLLSLSPAILSSRPRLDRPPQVDLIGQTPEIPKGQIVEKVICAAEPDQTYALYLPSNYAPGKKWLVLYAFDPGARGWSGFRSRAHV